MEKRKVPIILHLGVRECDCVHSKERPHDWDDGCERDTGDAKRTNSTNGNDATHAQCHELNNAVFHFLNVFVERCHEERFHDERLRVERCCGERLQLVCIYAK